MTPAKKSAVAAALTAIARNTPTASVGTTRVFPPSTPGVVKMYPNGWHSPIPHDKLITGLVVGGAVLFFIIALAIIYKCAMRMRTSEEDEDEEAE